MKLRVILIALLFLAPLTPSISATPPKAGAICSKAGVTKNSDGKKYTCVKSGKKLVWNKGIQIKSAATNKISNSPSPTPSPLPGMQTQNSNDVRNIIIRYHRPSGDYAGWNIWIWRNSDDNSKDSPISSSGINFEGVDSFGAGVSLTVTGMRDFKDIGFILRQGDWITRDIGKDRFITNFDSRGFAEIWLIQGDENVYTSKPNTTSKPSPTPSAMSTPSPTPTPATPKTRADIAYEAMLTLYAAQSDYKIPIKYVLAEKVNKSFLELIRLATEEAAKTFQKYYKPVGELPLIMGDQEDVDWAVSTLRKYGHELDEWGKSNYKRGYGTAHKTSQSILLFYTGDQKVTLDPNKNCIFCLLSYGAHEYMHVVTIGILGKSSTFGEVIPRWAYEGSAQFFGYFVAEQMPQKGELNEWMRKQGFKNFQASSRLADVRDYSPVLHSLSSQQLYETFTSPNIDRGDCPQTYCYTAGQFLIELLIADHGIEKYVSWLKTSAESPWRTAFEKTFGYNFNQWLAEIGIPYVMQEAQKVYPEQSTHPDYNKAITYKKN
ncbi:MAG: hypothetical protein EBX09_06605 [Actinobacteria bacterium]|nr:hypothetical protein [Actinomycetota bacterium]NCX76689.1 hypothetical protein [Actinomycetota bacterium]